MFARKTCSALVESPLTDWLREAYHLQDATAAKPVATRSRSRR